LNELRTTAARTGACKNRVLNKTYQPSTIVRINICIVPKDDRIKLFMLGGNNISNY
jgi:hypothetical protein